MSAWSSSPAGSSGATRMDAEGLTACLGSFTWSAFHLETLQNYGHAGARQEAFRNGLPMPVRSVRTSPYLRHLATATLAGKSWGRVHVVDHPLSEYVRYELVSYVESAAVGEQIGIADRSAGSELHDLRQDFWLFDAGNPGAYALMMRYDDDGGFLGADNADDRELAWCIQARDAALRYSVPLNEYLASAVGHQLA